MRLSLVKTMHNGLAKTWVRVCALAYFWLFSNLMGW